MFVFNVSFSIELGYARLLVQQDADEADQTTRHVAAIWQHELAHSRHSAG